MGETASTKNTKCRLVEAIASTSMMKMVVVGVASFLKDYINPVVVTGCGKDYTTCSSNERLIIFGMRIYKLNL